MSSGTMEDMQQSVIYRKAIHISGCLGMLYDQYRDQMLEQSDVKTRTPTVRKPKTAICKLIHGETDESENLLQMIGIQDDLRLSILLNLVPRTELISLINYPHPINKYTRFIHYTYISRIEKIRTNAKMRNHIESSPNQTNATHIITSVAWGMDFVVVLQLSNVDEIVEQIDAVLGRICSNLNGRKHHAFRLTSNEEDILQQITNTKVYSNIPSLTCTRTIRDIYLSMHQFQAKKNDHRPIYFELSRIQEVDLQNNMNPNTLNSRYGTRKKEIEQYLIQLSNAISYFRTFLVDNVSNLLRKHLKEQLGEVYAKYLDVEKKYTDEIKRFAELVINFRKNEIEMSEIEEALNSEQRRTLRKTSDELIENIKNLEAKEQFINDLQQKQFQYRKVTEYGVDSTDYEPEIAQTLINEDQRAQILCSSDTLNKDKLLELNRLRDLLIGQHQNNAELRLIYADFSYCNFHLHDISILSRDNMNKMKLRKPQISRTVPSENIVNILLLGESGVGKSTFINAFVNYLTFKTLTEAESNKPVVLIPISFLTTVGTDFQEQMVTFGDLDETNNEDFDQPGQSVTQRCKSYVFSLDRVSGKKLRIIDTPGFGDTRGLDQDDLNMRNILKYINNLTHLDAVCFLLKPNVARLNNYFRSCVTQLLDFLGPNARQNIIFCFTNSRCTFYAPGDTAPLLRGLLGSMPVNDIPFKKENTFCFDNESFRYLVALKNSIEISALDRNEYEKSWTTSAIESNRLIDYVCSDPITCNIHTKWKSTQRAQIEMIHMVRPILETMRNILRNIILLKTKSECTSIKLTSEGVDHPTTVCLLCKPQPIQLANFWITPNDLHGRPNKCFMCGCAPEQHISIDYTLRYEASNNPENHDENEMIDQVSLLLNASVEFACFLKSTAHSFKDDQFLIGLKRMIQEEKQICAKKEPKQLNEQLLKELKKLGDKYTGRMNEMKPNQNNIELAVVYERIKITRNYPDVSEQMDALETGQENMMKYYEQETSNARTNTPNNVSSTF